MTDDIGDQLGPVGEGAETSPPPAPKEPRTPGAVLATGLFVYIAVNVAYGLPMLVWPELLWETIGGADADTAGMVLATNRWAGGVLLGLAAGAVFVLMRPTGQRTFVTMLCIHTALAAAAILYSISTGEWDDAGIAAWFAWLSAIVVAAESGYLWYARVKARSVLAMPKP